MRWFKHYSDMHDGRSINDLLDKMGHTGLCFFLLQELCAEKLDVSSENLDESSTIFKFHQRIVRQKLRISLAKLERLLSVCQGNGLLSFHFYESFVEIKMPILLDLLDRDAKNARLRRAKNAQKPRLDKELELDLEEEKNKKEKKNYNTSRGVRKPANPLNLEIWKSYSDAFRQRYGHDPVRNASVNSKISQIAQRLGPEGVAVVRFFVSHNDSFYLKQVHSIGLCLKDAEALHTQWKRGKAITGTDIRAFEKTSEFQSQWERLADKV